MRVLSKIVVVMAVLALAGAGWVAASGEDSKPAEKKPAAAKAADPKCDPKDIEKAKDGKKEPVCKPAESKESFFTLEDIYAGKLDVDGAKRKADEDDDAVTWRKVEKKTDKKQDKTR